MSADKIRKVSEIFPVVEKQSTDTLKLLSKTYAVREQAFEKSGYNVCQIDECFDETLQKRYFNIFCAKNQQESPFLWKRFEPSSTGTLEIEYDIGP